MFTIQEIYGFVQHTLEHIVFSEQHRPLYEPVEYTLSIGGKRLRPMLCLMSYNLFSNNINPQVLLPAVGLEIFHNFTLIHDDIMDASDMRRNQPTVHKKWNVNTAILSGDVMSIKAYSYICQCDPEKMPAVLDIFNRVAAQVCEGQQLDMDYERQAIITESEYLQMIELKTAVLIAGSVHIGAVCGGASPKQAELLRQYGYALGMGFQIQDDLLDSYGEVGIFGKPIGGDIINNKKSWLLVCALNHAQGEDAVELKNLIAGSEQDPSAKIASMLALYDRLGVRELAEAKIHYFHNMAMEALDALDIQSSDKESLKDFTCQLLIRNR